MSKRQERQDPITLSFEIGSILKGERSYERLPVRGHIDADSAPLLADKLRQLTDRGHTRLELDFSDVQFISSTGIGTIVAALGECRDVGGDLRVVRAPEQIYEIFKTLDLLDYVSVNGS